MSDTFQDHFSTVASRYADFRPHYPAALFEYLAKLVPPGSTVWDCAAGNGQATQGLVRHFEKIIATDASEKQIKSATAHPRVEFRVALAEQSGLPEHSVELITVAQALHWFDLPSFYAEARRVLKPAGLLAVWAYGISSVEGAEVDRIVQHFYSDVLGPYWPPERRLVEDGYRTVPFPFVEIEPPAFQMKTQWTLGQLLGYFGTWSATNRCIQATGWNPIEPLSSDLAQVWGDADSTRVVTWPLSLRISRK